MSNYMQTEMIKPRPLLGVDFGADAPDLLTQMEQRIPEAIHREAKHGYEFLRRVTAQPAETQADIVNKLGLSRVDFSMPGDDSTALTIQVMAAALGMAAKAGHMTASERAQAAMDLLADRYQADW